MVQARRHDSGEVVVGYYRMDPTGFDSNPLYLLYAHDGPQFYMIDPDTVEPVAVPVNVGQNGNVYCPNCKNKIGIFRGRQYCPDCGQRLDWGDAGCL